MGSSKERAPDLREAFRGIFGAALTLLAWDPVRIGHSGFEKIFSEPCLKLPPGCANEVDAGMPPDLARLSRWQVERALASLSDGEKIVLVKIARLYARKMASSAARFATESKFFDAEP